MAQRSIPVMLREVREAHPRRVAFRSKRGGVWTDLAWTEAGALCRKISRALLALGVARGARVAILSQTRLEWVLCDLGILGCGAVTVGIYPSSVPADCAYILDHSESEILFVEDEEQLAKIASVREQLPKLARIVVFEPVAQGGTGIMTWDDFLRLADAVPEETLAAREREVGPEDLASIVYTSGTTGVPKGAMLTHANLLFVSQSAAEALAITPGGTYLLFLPLAHVFARLTVHLCVATANTIAFAESMAKVADNLREVRPTFIAGVPRVYEKLRDAVLEGARKAGGIKEKLFHWAYSIGRRASALEQARKPLPPGLALQRAVARALVFRKIEARLGGRIDFMISGAAPLDKAVAEFFHALGILILEGIGMTENSSFSHVNRRDRYRFGTVGPLGPGIEMKLAADDEILIRGPNVMQGYFKDPVGTQEAIDAEGWLSTGDLGRVDEDGFLEITGRKKDLLVTSGGKNVAPLKIERALRSSPYVGYVVVFGDRRKFITALLTLDPDRIRSWASQNGKSSVSAAALAEDPEVAALVQAEVDAANRQLAPFESVRKFRIVAVDFSIEGGEMTPTLKIKRKVVAEKYRALVEAMYQE